MQAERPRDPNFRRVAIVTGSARGIGAAVARRLAADGMAVAVVDLAAWAASSGWPTRPTETYVCGQVLCVAGGPKA